MEKSEGLLDSEGKDKVLKEALPFSEGRQDAALGHLIIDDNFFLQCAERIKAGWFNNPYNQRIWSAKVDFYKKYHKPPTEYDLVEHDLIQRETQAVRNSCFSQVAKCKDAAQHYSKEAIRGELTEWMHARFFYDGVNRGAELWNRGQLEEAYSTLESTTRNIRDAVFNVDVEAEFSVKALAEQIRLDIAGAHTFGIRTIDQLLLKEGNGNGGLLPGSSTILLAPVDIGKCCGADTPVIMYDGTTKMVQDVVVGDFLMGPDEQPRKVLSTTRGRGPLYRVVPNSGEPFVCNNVHVLSLKAGWDNTSRKEYVTKGGGRFTKKYCNEKKDDTTNIPLNEYIQKSQDWKNRHYLWRAPLAFSEKQLPINPYVFGLWIGDGHSHCAALTTMDSEISQAWTKWVEGNGDKISIWHQKKNRASTYGAVSTSSRLGYPRNSFSVKSNEILHNLGVLNHKHIPQKYLTSSRSQRLQLLAGIIDTDGYSGATSYELTTVSARLAQDYAYLARSLGFDVKTTPVRKSCQTGTTGTYYRLRISGQLSQVPVKLTRKKGYDFNTKNPLRSQFTVESIGVGDYYGFTLDGDHLYLLGDFTVTHNTSTMITIAIANIRLGKDVLFIAHEGVKEQIMMKMLCCLLGQNREWVLVNAANPDPAIQMRLARAEIMLRSKLTFIPMNRAGLGVETVVAAIRRRQEERMLKNGKGYDLLIDDYAAKLTTEEARFGKLEKRNRDEIVYANFTRLAEEYRFHSVGAIQTNREGSKTNRGFRGHEERLLEMEDVLESWPVMADAQSVITINRPPIAVAQNWVTFHIVKSKTGDTGWAVVCRSNYGCCVSHSDELGSTWYRGTSTGSERMAELIQSHIGKQIPITEGMD